MPVYLPTAVVGNDNTLITLGQSGEIMGWFWPSKDHAQHVHECLPCVYFGGAGLGHLSWTWSPEWIRHQHYLADSNVCHTELRSTDGNFVLSFTDVVPEGEAALLRRVELRNESPHHTGGAVFLFGDWNLGAERMGNGVLYSRGSGLLVQNHREAALAIGGDGMCTWQCGKAGENWGNNARYDLADGALHEQDLEIGDVNWAVGFRYDLAPGESIQKHWHLAMAPHQDQAFAALGRVGKKSFDDHLKARQKSDAAWLSPGLESLKKAGGNVAPVLEAAYKRSLLCLPLLCGQAEKGEGVAVAAPEFDPEFISCGGYGYFWPRDGAEYISGLIDAGYDGFGAQLFDWCAKHQDPSGLWHQRYFLNGALSPNWCLPPDMLQIDQVGAVLWGYGKAYPAAHLPQPQHAGMIRRAAEYLAGRLTEKGVHGNAFDTWETFVGSFTYSNASIYAALCVAGRVLDAPQWNKAADRVKKGVLEHFVREADGYKYLVRGFDARENPDNVVDSSSLGAIEPFGLLDFNDDADLALAEGTLRAISERLECDWEGGRAIRRFEGDAYVGGVPACVNTLWMARCCLKIARRLRELGRTEDANALTARADVYLQTVLHRATPTGLLPELMQGPEGQRWWAAPHGWAMSSFVSGVLALSRELAAV